jgi:hypothetical protein
MEYGTTRAPASRVTEVSKGGEAYKEKGEPIGTKPDPLVVKAVDCLISGNFLSALDISFSRHPFLMMPLSIDQVLTSLNLDGPSC